jgi:hypothetical protein
MKIVFDGYGKRMKTKKHTQKVCFKLFVLKGDYRMSITLLVATAASFLGKVSSRMPF